MNIVTNPGVGARIKWMDALKLFAILMVIWGHSVQHLLSSDRLTEPAWLFITSFHMPLFMVISGYFGASIVKYKFRDGFIKRFKQLIVPVICFSVIAIALGVDEFWGGKKTTSINSFWFLRSAFVCSMLYSIAFSTGRYRKAGVIITLLMSQCIPLWQINLMYPSFLFGVLVRNNAGFILTRGGSRKVMLISGLLFVLMLVPWMQGICMNTSGHGLSFSALTPAVLIDYLLRHFGRLAIGLVGATFFISMFSYLSHSVPSSRIGDYIVAEGKNTLGVYVLQTFLLEMYLKQTVNFDGYNPWVFNCLIVPLISLLVLAVCLLLIRLIHLSAPLSACLLGEKRVAKPSHT